MQACDVESWLIQQFSQLSQMEPESIELDRPFVDYNLDSSVAVSLAQELGRKLGAPLPVTLFWEYPTIRSLAAALSEEARS